MLETLEHLGIPSYAVDRQGIIRWVNQAARVLARGHAAMIVIGSRGA